VATIALIALGVYLLAADEHDETARARTLARTHGLAVVGLGLSISLDELAIGFSIGVVHLPLAPAIALIAAQAFVAAQFGMRLGSQLSERAREGAERAAGITPRLPIELDFRCDSSRRSHGARASSVARELQRGAAHAPP
jgi:putative Mn2+ efflux pump MntP